MRKMTEKSLSEAFCGESMAHMKYLIFADVAENEGFTNIARLFRAIAYAEFAHARNHARNLGYIKNTVDNLQTGIDGETYEIEEMYPAYLSIAVLQKEAQAEQSINYALAAEKIHAKLYADAKTSVLKGQDLQLDEINICPVCGYTHVGPAPEKCPVCNLPKEKFKKF
ncbi:MAG: rubrerythrin family protein [candidate division WOR-3 bacterium]|nr:rubrerythrin family protein [candidate division WOR-3 bacterium]MDW7987264.1 rubrerythrin family protein [candidate division WOR-3 bacterium]